MHMLIPIIWYDTIWYDMVVMMMVLTQMLWTRICILVRTSANSWCASIIIISKVQRWGEVRNGILSEWGWCWCGVCLILGCCFVFLMPISPGVCLRVWWWRVQFGLGEVRWWGRSVYFKWLDYGWWMRPCLLSGLEWRIHQDSASRLR